MSMMSTMKLCISLTLLYLHVCSAFDMPLHDTFNAIKEKIAEQCAEPPPPSNTPTTVRPNSPPTPRPSASDSALDELYDVNATLPDVPHCTLYGFPSFCNTTSHELMPFAEPSNVIDSLENTGWTLLNLTGSKYGIDLTKDDFEFSYAQRLSENDVNVISLEMRGQDKDKPSMYVDLRSVMHRRYLFTSIRDTNHYFIEPPKTNHSADRPTEEGVWFFLAGHACSINDPAQVDIDVYSLLELADKAVKGVPFYPRPIVESLIEGAVSKLNKDLGPLIRFLGERVLAKARAFSKKQHFDSAYTHLNDDEINIPAEFFQFWQELCQFAEKQIPFEDVLHKPVTLLRHGNVSVTMTNLITTGGPLLEKQFLNLAGFLDAHIDADSIWGMYKVRGGLLSNGKLDTTIVGSHLVKSHFQETLSLEQLEYVQKIAFDDANNFFRGFCNMTEDRSVITLYLGSRHKACPVRISEFKLMVEVFRGLRQSVIYSIDERRRDIYAASQAAEIDMGEDNEDYFEENDSYSSDAYDD